MYAANRVNSLRSAAGLINDEHSLAERRDQLNARTGREGLEILVDAARSMVAVWFPRAAMLHPWAPPENIAGEPATLA